MRNLIRITTLTVVTALMTTANADVLFSDSFESADLSASTASVNDINFRWTDANRTGIITQEDTSGRRVFPTRWDEYFNDGQDWSAKDGSYSLSVEYGAGVNMAEQRFAFDPQQELWISYWARVPTNFNHGGMNNKFFSIWGSTYDSYGTVTWQTRPNGSGGANIVVQDGGVMSIEDQSTPFISIPSDQGRWMNVVIYLKSPSSQSASDGVIRLWRKWEGENEHSLIQDINNAQNQWESGTLGYRYGYFLGWANDAFDETTYWLVDDVTFSSTNPMLIGSTQPIKSTAIAPLNLSGNIIRQ